MVTNARKDLLNRVEAAIRAYEPCLSCSSTHATGQMPLEVIIQPRGGAHTRLCR